VRENEREREERERGKSECVGDSECVVCVWEREIKKMREWERERKVSVCEREIKKERAR